MHYRNQIKDTLEAIGLYSEDAVNLLLGTMAQESLYGKYKRQIGGGPALSEFQIEPFTFNDIWNNFLIYKDDLRVKIMDECELDMTPTAEDLVSNFKLAVCMARVKYYRIKEPLPSTVDGYARYWKKYYNTNLGKGKVSEFLRNYKKYVDSSI